VSSGAPGSRTDGNCRKIAISLTEQVLSANPVTMATQINSVNAPFERGVCMFSIRITCYALCFLFFLLPPTRAQQLPSVPAVSYPDSPEGLRKLMGDLVAAAKTNSKRESQLVTSLRLPDAASWFADVFGPDNGATLAASYQRSAADLNQYAEGLFGYCAKAGINEIAIERLGTPGHPIFSDKILASMVHSAPLYRVSFRTENMEIATSENYVYVQGGFHRVDDDVFMSLPGMPTRRIRLGEHDQGPG